MPQHKTHLLVGFLVYVFLLYCVLFFYPCLLARKLELLAYTLIGSLFPDIDTKSKIQRVVYCMLFIVLLGLAYTNHYRIATIVALLVCVPLMVHHRTLFHHPLFMAALCAGTVGLTYLVSPAYTVPMAYNMLFFFAGMLCHVWADKHF